MWEEIDDRSGGIGCALRACWGGRGSFAGKSGMRREQAVVQGPLSKGGQVADE